MLAHSTRDRSRSPHQSSTGTNGTSANSKELDRSSPTESNGHNQNKVKKDNDSQQRLRSLKSFIQTLINDSTSSLASTTDEQIKALENACLEEYRDLSLERIRRMIRSLLKTTKSHPSSSSSSAHSHRTPSLLSQDHKTVVSNSNESNHRKSTRSNTSSNNKPTDLLTSPVPTLSALDGDFLRHAFSQQFCPSLDLTAYFPSAASTTNGSSPASPLFRPNFSPSSFLQSLTNSSPLAPPPPPPPPPPLVSSHNNGNGTTDPSSINITKSSKSSKLTGVETNSIRVLVNAYREAASYLCRSADELEQLI